MANFFLLYKFSLGFDNLHILHIRRWFNITIVMLNNNSSDDCSLEPKRYSVDFVSQ